ncbi:MAG: cobalt transporter [Bacteroidetes bacterium GWF2_40_14]|nr:MAG: cobalt transporter [Bacteroidetes bacterium GWF2_40_14]
MDSKEHNGDNANSISSGNIKMAFVLNFLFAIIELAGGLFTNSVAILSDALHDFGDSISLGVAYYLQKRAGKKSDEFYSYGYKRFSLLGSIFISIVLAVSSIFIIAESVKRVIEPQQSNATGMLLLAILGIIVNGAAVLRLKKGSSLNEKAVLIHMMEDVLGWIAVLIASVVMMFVNLPVIDPLLSIGITIWVLINVYKNLSKTLKIMLQEIPRGVKTEEFIQEITIMNAIESIHDLHLWSLDGENHILTMHVVLKKESSLEELAKYKQEIRCIGEKYGIGHLTIEFENTDEACDCGYKEKC